MKTVAGAPNIRPPWFFDTAEQGEGLNDIGTHLVDLVQWTLFPDRALDYTADVRVLAAQRWPTWIPEADFRRVTGEPRFLREPGGRDQGRQLEYYANTLVSYTVRDVHTKLNVIWDWEAPPGSGDTHFAFYKGTRARIEVRQTQADRYLPELYVVPAAGADKARGARRREGEDRGAAAALPRRRRRRTRRRDPRRPRGAPRRPRSAFRAGHRRTS